MLSELGRGRDDIATFLLDHGLLNLDLVATGALVQ
jgi:hypothetical protein